jgi:ABC-type dipeptide/oligopeptide/nickel transport system permease subunit
MATFAAAFSAVFGLVLLGTAFVCAKAAGRDHLSPWWLGSYSSLLAGFVVLAAAITSGA